MPYLSLFERDGKEIVVLRTLHDNEKNRETLRAVRTEMINAGQAVTLIATAGRSQDWKYISRKERRKRDRALAKMLARSVLRKEV